MSIDIPAFNDDLRPYDARPWADALSQAGPELTETIVASAADAAARNLQYRRAALARRHRDCWQQPIDVLAGVEPAAVLEDRVCQAERLHAVLTLPAHLRRVALALLPGWRGSAV